MHWRTFTLSLLSIVTIDLAGAGFGFGEEAAAGAWRRILVEPLPTRAMFVLPGDVDGDGLVDIISGAWWWRNPGSLAGEWRRADLGEPLRNMAAVYDFDGDGDVDVLGTQGVGSEANHAFVWGRNDGRGKFTILDNIEPGDDGDFLQGCAVDDFGQGAQVVLSWHKSDRSELHTLIAAAKAETEPWKFRVLASVTLKEDLDVGDIDRDGDLDLLLGTIWLRNDGKGRRWTAITLGEVPKNQPKGEPDRVDLADVNADGRLDAVVSLELGTEVYWFEAPADPVKTWTRHLIGDVSGQGFSMDTGDVDGDGDPDVVIGEHRGKEVNRVILFRNEGRGSSWKEAVLDSGSKDAIDHHDGTQLVDLDQDGDLDLISVGWYNPNLWILENLEKSK